MTFDSEAETSGSEAQPGHAASLCPSAPKHCLCAPSDSGEAESLAAYFDVFAELGPGDAAPEAVPRLRRPAHSGQLRVFATAPHPCLWRSAWKRYFADWSRARRLSLDLVIAPNLRYYDTRAPPGLLLRVLQPQGHQQAAVAARPARLGLRQSGAGSTHFRSSPRNGLNLGVAALADVTFMERWSVLAGARWDRYDLTSTNGPGPFVTATPNASASTVQKRAFMERVGEPDAGRLASVPDRCRTGPVRWAGSPERFR